MINKKQIVIGTSSWGSKINLKKSLELGNKLISIGLNHFDTAPTYGAGYSHYILNNLSKNNHVLVDTKYGEITLINFKEIIKKSNFPIRAFIVGDGEEKHNLINYVRNINLDYSLDTSPATFHFTSWIKEIDEVNSGMDIICLTSLNEGTPVSLIEAQANGKPIVSTKTGGIKNIVCLLYTSDAADE